MLAGQEICKPTGPRCDLCDVAKVARLCPSKRVVSPKKGSPSKVKKEEQREHSPKIEIGIEVEKTVVKEEEEIVDQIKGGEKSLHW